MAEKKKQKKNGCCKETSNKVDVIYEILVAHEHDLASLDKKVEEMSVMVDKIKGRMGL